MSQEHRTLDRNAVVAVIGLGYVGLPLATAFAKAGIRVVGVDPDDRKVARIRRGESYIRDISSEDLRALAVPDDGRDRAASTGGSSTSPSSDAAPRLTATTDYATLADCDAIFICVPTPFDSYKTPDLSFVVSATQGIAEHLRPGHLVVLQSTTFPGTTEEVVQPLLEQTGLRAGRDFHLAFSPERIDPGNPHWNAENLPKIVGGVTIEDGEMAADLLRLINPHVNVVSTTRTAEMTKLLENIFRSVNIALVNELALLAERMDLDIWEVIQAAATKPFGYLPFYPGPGVGGHCIPVDPYYLSWKAREYDFTTRFIDLAAETNQRMPYHVVELIGRALAERGTSLRAARVLILGTAFKANVEDARNSPAERVIELLLDRGSEVIYHDPYVPTFEIGPNPFYAGERRTFESQPLTEDLLGAINCVVILVPHRGLDYERVVRLAPIVVDTVNAIGAGDQAKVVRLGAGFGKRRIVEPVDG